MTDDFKAIVIAARPGDSVFIRLPSEPNKKQRDAIQGELKTPLPPGVKAGVLGPVTEVIHVLGEYVVRRWQRGLGCRVTGAGAIK